MPRRADSAASLLLAGSAFASGTAALILELQWGRQLALVFGGAHAAVAAVLAAFMLGLGVGSYLGGRVADRVARPALAVAGLELGLAVAGPVLSLVLIHLPSAAAALLPGVATVDNPVFLLSRLGLALALLALPTTLMGATFPIMVRALGSDLERLHGGIGRIYAASTIGGVVGVVAAGFWVLPIAGIPGSFAAAAAANLVAAGAALAAHRVAGDRSAREGRPAAARPVALPLLAAAAVSGALVLGAETLWHRALKMVLANSTATLTLLLALTLAGIGLGAAAAAPLLRRQHHLRSWSIVQLAAAAVLVAQAAVLPEIAEMVRTVRPDTGWPRLLVPPIAVGGMLILPATLLFGAAWPLLLAAATPRIDDGGRSIGRMAVANSLGAAVGSVVVGIALLPALGFGRSVLALAAAAAALAALGELAGGRRGSRPGPRLTAPAAITAVILAAGAAAAPSFGRVILPSLAADDRPADVLSYRETPSGTVVVTEDRITGARSMSVDNNAVIGDRYDALKVARMLGVVPALVHPQPDRALVIGFGAGVTTATLAATPGVTAVDVVEIVPGVIEAAGFFERLNHGIQHDSRVRLHANDGRNHLLLHPGPWDVITCDPVHPLYGSAPLYSREFFELARRRLASGGIACQYLPLHRMPSGAFRRAITTFREVFPDCWVLFGLGHAMLLGADEPVTLDWERWRRVLARHPLRDDLASSSLHHPAQIAALLQLDPEGCRTVGAGAPSTDLHPHLEFLAPDAYEPDLWRANARLLVEGYRSPIARIANLPPGMNRQLERLVAGKRLLLFSLLERADGNHEAARQWLARARQIAGDDPEIALYARQLAAERRGR